MKALASTISVTLPATRLYDLTHGRACVGPHRRDRRIRRSETANDSTVARDFVLGMTADTAIHGWWTSSQNGNLVELMSGAITSCVVLAWYAGRRARLCSAAPGWQPIGCSAKALSGATAIPTKCAAPSGMPRRATDLAVGQSACRQATSACWLSWPIGRSTVSSARRTKLHALQFRATRR